MMVNVACEHKIAEHEHGTHACYVLDQCRCIECRQATRSYERSRTLWLAGVRPSPLVDAKPVRTHVESLIAQGMGMKRIAEVSGVPHGGLWKLIYGKNGEPSRSKRVRRETARRLLATRLDLADGAKIPAVEARTIIDELLARGWTKTAIAKHVHGPSAVSLQVAQPHRSEVTAGTLATLRVLLYEPVPLRVHNPTGRTFQPKPKRPPCEVDFTTPGVRIPAAARTRPAPAPIRATVFPPMAGVLRCKVCNRPLSEHSLMERCA